MDTLGAVRTMIDRSGESAYSVALELGRTHSYVSGMLRRGSVPSGDILAAIAHACGYDLCLVPRDGGDVIAIDGRRDTDTER